MCSIDLSARGKGSVFLSLMSVFHMHETPAYQRRPTTQYAAQGSNPWLVYRCWPALVGWRKLQDVTKRRSSWACIG